MKYNEKQKKVIIKNMTNNKKINKKQSEINFFEFEILESMFQFLE